MRVLEVLPTLRDLGSFGLYLTPGLGSYLSTRTARYIPKKMMELDVPSVIISGLLYFMRTVTVFPAYWAVPSVVFHNLPLGVILGSVDLAGYVIPIAVEQYRKDRRTHQHVK